jgi:hypothetical protein
MSLNKAIKHGKEHRKPYKGSKAFDYSCRNHGSCAYCSLNRQVNKQRAGNKNKEATDGLLDYYEDMILY